MKRHIRMHFCIHQHASAWLAEVWLPRKQYFDGKPAHWVLGAATCELALAKVKKTYATT